MTIDGRKVGHDKLEEIRLRVVRVVQEGKTPTEAAREAGVAVRRVFEWLAKYRLGGWDALKSRKSSGRPKRLTGARLQWIYTAVTERNPLQLKFTFALWTRPMIRTLIYRKFNVTLSLASIGRLLAQMGLTCQRPLAHAFEQDASLVKKWLVKEYPKIQALAKKEDAAIFFGDESGIRSDFHAGTTWSPKGTTPIIRRTGKRYCMNMISAVSAKGELRFMTSKERISTGLFIEFLKRLILNYPKKIFLIVDGLSVHKAKAVREFLEKEKNKIKLFHLPPYSPELNPDELVWNEVKNNGVGREIISTVEDLQSSVQLHLRKLQRNREKVRSFFQKDTTRYAA